LFQAEHSGVSKNPRFSDQCLDSANPRISFSAEAFGATSVVALADKLIDLSQEIRAFLLLR
jgi:hypothetical protein